MSGNASQRQGDRKSKEIPEAGEEENGSGPVEKAGKRFHPDHTGRRKLGNGFGNAAGQLGTKAGSKGGLRQDVQFQPFRIDETQTEIRPGQSGRGEHTMNGPLTGGPASRERSGFMPYGSRVSRQGRAFCSGSSIPVSAAHRWMSALVRPAEASGDRMPSSSTARMPGRYCPASEAFVPSHRGRSVRAFSKENRLRLHA